MKFPSRGVISSSLPLSRSSNVEGQIHSLFSRSYNIAFGRDLVNVASADMECSSYGLKLSIEEIKFQIKSLNMGDRVFWEGSQLQLFCRDGDVININLAELSVLDLKLMPTKPTMERVEAAARSLESAVTLEDTGLPLDDETLSVLRSLCQPDLTEIAFQLAFDFLIGRGRGLTPSGDDVLLGYLMVLKLFGISLGLEKMNPKHYQDKTTLISENYLKMLFQGYVSEYLKNFCQAASIPDPAAMHQTVAQIKGLGATSGTDMLLGMAIGISKITGVNLVLPTALK